MSTIHYPTPYPPLLPRDQGQGEALNPLPCHGELAQVTQHEDCGEEPEHQHQIIICMQLHLIFEPFFLSLFSQSATKQVI